jgi:hypothetical protein
MPSDPKRLPSAGGRAYGGTGGCSCPDRPTKTH